jgi:hypothetical protein
MPQLSEPLALTSKGPRKRPFFLGASPMGEQA